MHGKVWELDGLRAGPLEVGATPDPTSGQTWVDVARPAIRQKMESLQSGMSDNIRFNLLAIVEGGWDFHSDRLEFLRKDHKWLTQRLDEIQPQWRENVSHLIHRNTVANINRTLGWLTRTDRPLV